MSNAFVCFRGGKPLNLQCRDAGSSANVTEQERKAWARDMKVVESFERKHGTVGSGIANRFGLVDRGTVTKAMDLEMTARAPDGDRKWHQNKDFVDHERRRGNPVLARAPELAREAKSG